MVDLTERFIFRISKRNTMLIYRKIIEYLMIIIFPNNFLNNNKLTVRTIYEHDHIPKDVQILKYKYHMLF